MTTTDIEPILNHLRAAVRNGVILLPTVFFIGALTGWALAAWPRTHVGAIAGTLFGLVTCTWVTWAFYRTRGLMHYSGFGRWTPEADDTTRR